MMLALHLLDATGARVAQLAVPVNANTTWKPGAVTTLDYRMPLPQNLAPGRYRLLAIVYSRSSAARKAHRMRSTCQPSRSGLELSAPDSVGAPVSKDRTDLI